MLSRNSIQPPSCLRCTVLRKERRPLKIYFCLLTSFAERSTMPSCSSLKFVTRSIILVPRLPRDHRFLVTWSGTTTWNAKRNHRRHLHLPFRWKFRVVHWRATCSTSYVEGTQRKGNLISWIFARTNLTLPWNSITSQTTLLLKKAAKSVRLS